MAAEDKSIGKLTLDITDIQAKVAEVDKLLGKVGIGAKVDLSKNISAEVKKQLDSVLKEIKGYETKINEAVTNAAQKIASVGNQTANNNTMKQAVALWKEYYNVMSQAESKLRGGDTGRFNELRQEAQLIHEKAAALKSEKEVWEQTAAARRNYYNSQSSTANTEHIKQESEATAEAVKLWKEYYVAMEQAEKALQGGNTKKFEEKREEARAIHEAASALMSEKEVWEQTAAARNKYYSAQQGTAEKERLKNEAQAAKELADAEKQAAEEKEKLFQIKSDAEQAGLQKLIDLYRQYYEAQSNKINAVHGGNIESADYYRDMATAIEADIQAIENEVPALGELARASEQVVAAKEKMNAVAAAGVGKSDAAMARQEADNVDAYARALVNLYNEQTKLNNALATGKIKEGSEEYEAAKQKIENFEKAVVAAGTNLDRQSISMVGNMDKVRAAADALVQSESKINDASQIPAITQMENAYKNLTLAIQNYNTAKKSKDESGMAYWQNQINASMSVVSSIQQEVNTLNVDADTRQRILTLIEQCKTAQNGFNAGVTSGVAGTNELESQLMGIATRLFSIMAVIRMINNLVSSTVEYVSEYYDKMNEIQIITTKSNEEVAKLGETYRQIAEDMNVSSLAIADAAIYFTRQGLKAEEIEKRLKYVTMYAKTANVEFTEASEIITAVVNSMNLVEQEAEDGRNAAQRVADTFLLIGDNAATSGQEIGSAMQKAAAAAGTFGISLEWLSSAIATVSETTRQEARTIGTAFNTIIARLHNIRSTGFNADDNTRVNDIAKALHSVNIELMDGEDNWRDSEVIFSELAAVWDTLTDKQKSYIATTMAGVKQQNVFLALMKDMSKGVENGSRMFELYDKAVKSAGTSEEKYAIYKDSVTASQERLNVAQEKFYSLMDASVIKSWNDVWAGWINNIADGANALSGINIILPVVIGLIAAVIIAIKGLNMKLAETNILMYALESHPIMLAISAAIAIIFTLVTAISAANAAIETAAERFDNASKAIDESNQRLTKMVSTQKNLKSMMEDLGDKTEMTSDDFEKYNGLLDELSQLSPGCKETVDNLRDGLIDQKEATEQLNAEMENLIENERTYQALTLARKYDNWTPEIVGDNGEFLTKMGQWHTSWSHGETGLKGFAESLKYIWNMDAPRVKEDKLTYDVAQKIGEYLKTYGDSDQSWEHIAQLIWQEYVGNDTYSLGETLKSYADDAINEAIQTLGYGMNSSEKDLLREMLFNYIAGDDNEVSMADYKDMGKKIKEFVMQYLDVAQGDLMSMNPSIAMEHLGKQLFGNFFSMLFDPEDIAYVKTKPELIKAIYDAYTELIEAGFNDQEIANFLKDKSVVDWDQMVDMMSESLRDSIKQKFGTDFLGEVWEDLDAKDIEETSYYWDELDVATLKVISDMADAGVSIEEINSLMANSESVDEFIAKLKELAEASGVDVVEGAEEAEKSLSDFIKDIKSLKSEIANLDKLYAKAMKQGKLTPEDVLGSGLAEAHPELLVLVDDFDALIARINELKQQGLNELADSVEGIIWNSESEAQRSPFAEQIKQAGAATLKEYRDMLELAGEDFSDIDNYVKNSADAIRFAAEETEEAADTWLQAQEKILRITEEVNWAKSNGFIEQINMLERAYNEGGDANVLKVWKELPEEMREAIAKEYPHIVVELAKIEKEFDTRVENIKKKQAELYNGNVDLNNRPVINTQRLIDAGWDTGTGENAFDSMFGSAMQTQRSTLLQTEYWAGNAEGAAKWNQDVIISATPILENGEVLTPDAWEEYLNDLLEKSGNIDELINNDKTENGGYGIVMNVTAVDNGSFEEKQQEIDKLTESVHEMHEEMYLGENAASHLGDELNYAKEYAGSAGKTFEGTYKAIKQLREGTISATDAYDTYNKELDKVTKAQEDINDVQQQLADGTSISEIALNDVSNLASLLGMTADEVLADFPAAVAMFNELIGETGELRTAFDALNEAAFIRITGTSDVDFSALEQGLYTVQGIAKETIDLLTATGQWKVESRELNGLGYVLENGQWVAREISGYQDVLVPTGQNPYKGTSSTGSSKRTKDTKRGGGGSSKSDGNKMTEVEIALSRMSQIHDIQSYQRSYYQSQGSYFEQTGYLQGVIEASEKEIGLLQTQNETLEGNIKTIEKYMEAKRQELSGMSMTDEKYEEVRDDLDKLQKAHQSYTKELVDNKTAIEQLNDAIQQQKDKIRDMQISLRQTIYKAIEDREKKSQAMLQSEISMENTIIDLLKRKYEIERDKILENTDARIDALTTERDLLSEQLQLRKEMAEKEDKAARLAQLEASYQRIIADPTRAKEAQKIQEDINELREEIAWQAAEDEVKAQQESIDQQIDSLDDYKQYIEEYYEDLFEHPKKLIEEMKTIISGTDEQIIEWLKENSEEFAASSENTQLKMIADWTQTLDDMHGKIKTYWDEVEQIIAGGDEYIIQFLKENSDEYAKAGELQAQKYVDQWKKQLEDLHKALQSAFTVEPQDYTVMDPGSGSGSSGGGGGGGGSGSNGRYKFSYTARPWESGAKSREYKGYKSESDAKKALESLVTKDRNALAKKRFGQTVDDYWNSVLSKASRQTPIVAYKRGGLATNTGLAWLDGTASNPERVLSPYQTQLFETMVQALEKMSTVTIPAMSNFGNMQTGNSNSVSVGDIIVNVDNLDTDDDYEELADRVSAVLMERIGKTAVIGGLRINSN